jgi:hypothetical protein
MSTLRVKHAFTAYHLRDRLAPGKPSRIAICSCGWKCSMFRRSDRRQKVRALVGLCWLRGHAWEADGPVHVGPVGFDESEETRIATMRQCARCYRCETISRNAA